MAKDLSYRTGDNILKIFNSPPPINNNLIPPNAMDKSNESSFRDALNSSVDNLDLSLDDKILEVEGAIQEKLKEINVIAHNIAQSSIKDSDDDLNTLKQLVNELIIFIKENKCTKTNNHLLEIFNNIESKFFNPQINLIKKSILQS